MEVDSLAGRGDMLDTVLEHVARVTMDEEGEEVGWSRGRWRDESVPSVRCVPVAGCSCVLHNTAAARSYLHAEDRSLEVLNLDIDAVMNTQY